MLAASAMHNGHAHAAAALMPAVWRLLAALVQP
jgi:hypothetical protein